jgi:hypothetical protein
MTVSVTELHIEFVVREVPYKKFVQKINYMLL